METKEEIKQEKITTDKKECTFIAQIIASIWIGGWNTFQFIKTIINNGKVDVSDIIISGFAIAGCFAPVYISIILDKIKDIRSLKND